MLEILVVTLAIIECTLLVIIFLVITSMVKQNKLLTTALLSERERAVRNSRSITTLQSHLESTRDELADAYFCLELALKDGQRQNDPDQLSFHF